MLQFLILIELKLFQTASKEVEERGKPEYPEENWSTRGKPEYPGENLSEQRREPTNSTHI